MIAHEKDFQCLRVGAEEKADFQTRTAFKYILSQSPDGDSRMEVRLAEAVGQNSQCLFRPAHVCVAQFLEFGQKARAEQNGRFSHVSVFQ
jgi:hypothetical protein